MDSSVQKIRVLLITRNFPPLTGGMERLMQNMSHGLAEYTELTIVGPRGCAKFTPKGAQVHEAGSSLVPFLIVSLWYALRACRKTKFDLIIGGSGLIAPALLILRGIFGRKTMVYVHGLDLVVDSWVYQRIFLACLRRLDTIVANSGNTRRIALDRGVPSTRIVVVNPGTSLPEALDINTRTNLLKPYDIPFKKIMIFVGRMTQRKGLSRFIESSLPDIIASEPDSGLLIIGDNADQALTKNGERENVLDLVGRMQLGSSVVFLGQISDIELQACYASATVQIFPIIDVPGDIEGFGMVAIEAAANGTPTVAFNVGGVADAISKSNGDLVEPGKYDHFSQAVLGYLRQTHFNSQQCIDHAKQYSWEQFNKKLAKVILSPGELETYLSTTR